MYGTELLTTPTLVSATNLVTNGDFSNGTTGWVGITAIVGGRASKLATSQYQTINQQISVITGHKYYFCIDLETDASNAVYWGPTGAGVMKTSSGLQHLSQIYTSGTTGLMYIGVGEFRTSNFTTWYFDNFLCIDLTALFGAGNEPTAQQMDSYLEGLPNN